jgi:broad specificity phosphatase PhoE
MEGATKVALRRCQSLQHSLRTLPRQLPSWGAYQAGIRLHSSCTIDLTTNDGGFLSSAFSTLQVSALRDVPPTIDLEPEFSGEIADQHWNALLTAAASSASQPSQTVVTAHEMDLVEAASKRNLYDKILLLVKHGDSKTGTSSDPGLTGRGVGQTLNVSRRVATFCNDETGLLPELVVTAPLRRAVDTAMLVFPNYTPESVRSIPWLCHPGLTDVDEHDASETEHGVPASDVGDAGPQIDMNALLVQSKQELLRRSDAFVEWLRNRDEQVVVGK